MTLTIEELQAQLAAKEQQVLTLTLALMDERIAKLEEKDGDKETRLRAVETSRTRFETLAWLAFGGGIMSLINLLSALKGP
ncbi:MAG: hypothetical protein HY869_20980 [Chloroflexi bacterium]|nr:hypothetical protein [Chloroflexota bacterium]